MAKDFRTIKDITAEIQLFRNEMEGQRKILEMSIEHLRDLLKEQVKNNNAQIENLTKSLEQQRGDRKYFITTVLMIVLATVVPSSVYFFSELSKAKEGIGKVVAEVDKMRESAIPTNRFSDKVKNDDRIKGFDDRSSVIPGFDVLQKESIQDGAAKRQNSQ